MTTKPPSKAYRPTKTLFTPVLYGSSQAGPSSAAKQPATSSYLTSLSCTHIALAHTVQEVPSSRCGSPVDGEEPPVDKESEARVEELRKRVAEAREAADWNPTDGNWAALSQILHMSVTSGRYRWMGARTDGELSEPGINAGTESEWVEWERRRAEEDRLKRKIENWKKTVDVDLVDPSPPKTIESKSISRECLTHVEGVQCVVQDKPVDVEPKKGLKAATTQAKLHDPLMIRSGLGFSVVKRNTQALAGKPKPTPKTRDSDNAAPRVKELFKPEDHSVAQERNLQEDAGSLKQPSKPGNSEDAQNVQVFSHSKLGQPDDLEASIPLKNQPTRTIQSIANISETSYLPPSFPSSQMITSTPKRDQNPEQCRQKPAPIPSAPPSTPPSSITPRTSSPLLNKAKGQPRTSQSLPVIPTTPTGPNGHQTLKRPVSPTSPIGRPAKKARTMPVLPSSDKPASNATPPESSSPIAPTTPKSSDKNRIILDSGPTAAAVGLTTPKRRPLPTLTELLASSKKGKKLGSPSRKPKSPLRSAAEQLMIKADVPNNDNDSNHAQGHLQITTTRITAKAGRFPSPLDNPFMLDPYALSAHHDELEPDAIASPTKSLSSIAESDSDPEDEDDEEGGNSGGFTFDPDDEFDPPFQSTQQGGKQHKFGGWMGYNSQFDVDGQVSQVDKLLEKDVQVDYDGWLRDPSNEPPEVPLDSSP